MRGVQCGPGRVLGPGVRSRQGPTPNGGERRQKRAATPQAAGGVIARVDWAQRQARVREAQTRLPRALDHIRLVRVLETRNLNCVLSRCMHIGNKSLFCRHLWMIFCLLLIQIVYS